MNPINKRTFNVYNLNPVTMYVYSSHYVYCKVTPARRGAPLDVAGRTRAPRERPRHRSGPRACCGGLQWRVIVTRTCRSVKGWHELHLRLSVVVREKLEVELLLS